MIARIIRRSLFGVSLILGTPCVADWSDSPMSWSADGDWLSYSTATDHSQAHLRLNWLFDTGSTAMKTLQGAASEPKPAAGRITYQIWATHRNLGTSVLIEQSRWPLSAPAWSPRRGAIAYARFVPQTIEPELNQAAPRGRYEIVIQSGMNQKRVLWTSSDSELNADTLADISSLAGVWSPDGKHLAFSRPGRESMLMIVGTESGRVEASMENSSRPAWSPDGSRIAFIQSRDKVGLYVSERHGQSFSVPRKLSSRGVVRTTPWWSNDGRSILVVTEKTARPRELSIERIAAERAVPGQPLLSLAAEPILRSSMVRGAMLEFDREGERFFFSVDLRGRDAELGYGIMTGPQIVKRFHPLDCAMPIAALAVSPDDRFLAIRFGQARSSTPPVLYDLSLEQPTLIVPDEICRREWLGTLIGIARDLLVAKLPAVSVDGHLGRRPTLLPLPGELAANDILRARVARIARFAEPLIDQPPHQAAAHPSQSADSLTIEAHLFVSYLKEDFDSAATDLDALQPLINEPDNRLALLSLRAQILWSQGQQSRAQAIVDYLVAAEGSDAMQVEETPAGLAVTTETTPRATWVHYLSSRAREVAANPSSSKLELPTELNEIPIQNPFAAPDVPAVDNR